MLVDFWTYTCINCLRTLPHLRAWDDRYGGRGLTIVGVHTPEFSFEHETANVRRAIARNRLRYPVLQDNDYATWSAWGNQFWPAKYLIDARGEVRYTHFGEGGYGATEKAIRSLLREAGSGSLGGYTHATGELASPGTSTPRDLPRLRTGARLRAGGRRSRPARYPGATRLRQSRFAIEGSGAAPASPPAPAGTPRCRLASWLARSSSC